MSPLLHARTSFGRGRAGQGRTFTAVEYGLIAGLVVVTAIGGVSLMTNGAAEPGPPSLRATEHNRLTRLTFSAEAGRSVITGFVLERADDSNDGCGGSLAWSTLTRSGSSPHDTSFDGDNCWRVAAVNSAGQGPWSSIVYHAN